MQQVCDYSEGSRLRLAPYINIKCLVGIMSLMRKRESPDELSLRDFPKRGLRGLAVELGARFLV
jgi:hypothetical protein